MNNESKKILGMKFVFARSDMMGFIPKNDQDMVYSVQKKQILDDEDITQLRFLFYGRDIDSVIRCHILNNRELYTSNTMVPTEFQDWFLKLNHPVGDVKIVNALSQT